MWLSNSLSIGQNCGDLKTFQIVEILILRNLQNSAIYCSLILDFKKFCLQLRSISDKLTLTIDAMTWLALVALPF